MNKLKPTCLAIMPFGEKQVGELAIDFDLIWSDLISSAAIEAGFHPERADSGAQHGVITPKMLDLLFTADVAVVDVTYFNPNVFYELGVRHALCRHGTILINRVGGDLGARRVKTTRAFMERKRSLPKIPAIQIPFDLKDVVHLPYVLSTEALPDQINLLKNAIISRYKTQESDSPVFTHITGLRIGSKSVPLSGRRDGTYEILDRNGVSTGKRIGYRSGDIANLTLASGNNIDFWVNSENTLMQMARIYERSVSSTIRYLGATHADARSTEYIDTIQDALTVAMGNRHVADEGEVLVTDSGRLRASHGVKAVLHAAVVTGKPGMGFEPISDERLCRCVALVVETARNLIRKGNEAHAGRSLMMPIFGTGQGRRDPIVMAGQLVTAAVDALLEPARDLLGRDLDMVMFAALGEQDVALMRRICDTLVEDRKLKLAIVD